MAHEFRAIVRRLGLLAVVVALILALAGPDAVRVAAQQNSSAASRPERPVEPDDPEPSPTPVAGESVGPSAQPSVGSVPAPSPLNETAPSLPATPSSGARVRLDAPGEIEAQDGPPVAHNDTYVVASGGLLEVSAADGLLANDEGGELFVNLQTLVWHPVTDLSAVADADFFADGSFWIQTAPDHWWFLDLSYEACLVDDPAQCSPFASVTIVLPPVANDDTYYVVAGQDALIDAPGLLANDEGPNLAVDYLNMGVAIPPELQGSVGAAVAPSGGFAVMPQAGVTGQISFYYRACYVHTPGESQCIPQSGSLESATARINIIDPLVANPDAYAMVAGGTLNVGAAEGLLTNDTGLIADVTVPEVVETVSSGTLTLDGTGGAFTYVPAAGFSGTDAFTYRFCATADNTVCSAPATVSLTVIGPPVAHDDSYTIEYFPSGQAVTSLTVADPGVLSNDVAPEGYTLAAELVTAPQGDVVLAAPGGFTYTPPTPVDPVADPGFTYRVCLMELRSICSEPASVTFAWEELPVPLAVDDTYEVLAGQRVTLSGDESPLANDADPNGGNMIATGVTYDVDRSVYCEKPSLTPDGTLMVRFCPWVAGEFTMQYTIQSATYPELTASGTITFVVTLPPAGGSPSPFPTPIPSPSPSTSPSPSPSPTPSPSPSPSPSEVPDETVTLTVTIEAPDGSPLSPVCFTWEPDGDESRRACDVQVAGSGMTTSAAQAGTPGVVTFTDLAPGEGWLRQELTEPGYVVAEPQRLTLIAGEDVSIVVTNGVAASPSPRVRTSPSPSSERPDVPTAPPSAAPVPTQAPSASPAGSELPAVEALPNTGQGQPTAAGGVNRFRLVSLLAALVTTLVIIIGGRIRAGRP